MEALQLYLLQQPLWKIVTLGVLSLLAAFGIITALAMLAYAFLPVWIAVILHVAAIGYAGYYLGSAFAAAFIVRRWLENLVARQHRVEEGKFDA